MNFEFKNHFAGTPDADLLKMYKQYDQYQHSFVEELENEMNKRGVDYGKIRVQNEHRKQVLSEILDKGEPGNKTFIIIGFVSACLGGLLGIIAGYIYNQSKRTALSGERYFAYDQKTRDLGAAMMFVGLLVLAFSMFWRFMD
jgi:hypothetical protein